MGLFYEIREKAEEVDYKVVCIPYFMQLYNDVDKRMFGREAEKSLFDSIIPSLLDVKGGNTLAYCCSVGLKRMVYEFRSYPEKYQVNLKMLKEANGEYLTGVSFLEEEHEKE